MTELRPSRPEEAEAQKQLWKTAFLDGDQDVDLFYESCWKPEDMLLLLEDGKLASMLALLPEMIVFPGGKTASSYYVYALATAPQARGKGYARQLLRYMDAFLRKRGVDCVTTVPAEPSLHRFFAAVDFIPCFSTWTGTVPRSALDAPAPGDTIAEIGPEEYGRIRNAHLAGTPHVRYGTGLLGYQQGMGRLYGGGLYRVTADGTEGCAAAGYMDGENVLLKELLLPSEKIVRGLALLAQALPAGRFHVRMPAGQSGLSGGEVRPFGMIKWYNEEKASLWGRDACGYMGLGFD